MLRYETLEYVTVDGRRPFNEWLEGLRDIHARARIDTRLDRVSLGNLGDHASVGGGVHELRIFYGPGYRVYYTHRDNVVVILLCGGDKSSQTKDVKLAYELAEDLEF